ncbi:type 1 glutamine amidotransferase [Pseudomonas viridiflava]|uniref:type 1 glutamine amidotransferase n=1 Tax=Pseudomonas viridiflava TaxID=33069 RepID=UPI000F026A4E|nr:type 1 glutamine amidotransferase [Pseudomonas viridiflava]MEE3923829.1 type 1 glutamine amidotransferase [Pseudomonas viridiflava]MEE3928859.1 type 1 glutamine amidotransferase [Pseudomonas viridiflava]MEE3939483.1 type 1 glutamine amidotransferase [Pseudomonas viridiflava]MEE3966963.1 type 1 glutamine amidotransferase [Pseudomonas viridiflava]MEE3981089.1 type 1 glutamine amidotransferase [Pseudomonas viridiflava]
MKVHFIVHESFEAPGAYEEWVHERGYEATYSRVYADELLPVNADSIDLLVVLGGPQSPATTLEECPHFNAADECRLISQAIAANRAVIGICLGSQLIGEALGAPFERSPEKEIGKFPIKLTADGEANSKFIHFGDLLQVGHWHNDMPGLTAQAKILAVSNGCPRQIVEYGNLVYGFQCHMEFTSDVVELLIAASEPELVTLTNHRFVQQPAALRAHEWDDMNQKLFTFLDKLVVEYKITSSQTSRTVA